MGAGLPFICGYDEELYKPTTFYIHEEFQELQDFVDTLSEDFDNYNDSEEYIESLVRGFRESGIVISEGRHAKIVTSTESDDQQFVVAIIPLSLEDVLEDNLYLLDTERDKVLEDEELNIIYNRISTKILQA